MVIRQGEVRFLAKYPSGPYGFPSSEMVTVNFLVRTEHLKLSLLIWRANSTNVIPAEAGMTFKARHYWFGLDSGLLDSESAPDDEIHGVFWPDQ